ncbi:MAG: hypothetical protein PHI94_07385 [Eubacteriaceae bacterium]|jgi:hypothetical protein|nr:hypothetical protein [Eubacteriaceae bacterium]MDD4508708.1 hypothetical protein [Eubacteriaceae bacterium]
MLSTTVSYNPGKKIRRICSHLGHDFNLRRLDGENVITYDLGNGTVSIATGLDNIAPAIDATITIWSKDSGLSQGSFSFKGTEDELGKKLANPSTEEE